MASLESYPLVDDVSVYPLMISIPTDILMTLESPYRLLDYGFSVWSVR